MSDLNDDLLNYELGDDIDDQALYGADEDELLLSDDELEKDVTNEVKQQLKAEAEQWVQSQIGDQQQHSNGNFSTAENKDSENTKNSEEKKDVSIEVSSVSSAIPMTATISNVAVSSNEAYTTQSAEGSEFKHPSQSIQRPPQSHCGPLLPNPQMGSHSSEVTSSCNREMEMSHSPLLSCSTTSVFIESSYMQCSHEGLPADERISGDYSDPREDPDEEREERTNIKITNEREMEHMAHLSPDKNNRSIYGKRGGNPLLHSGPHLMRGGPYPGLRPLLRYPPHGQFPSQQQQQQQQQQPTPPPQPQPHPYASHTLQPNSSGGLGANATAAPPSSPQPQLNPNTQNIPHLHDPHHHAHQSPQLKPRQSYPIYRPGGGPGGFRPNLTGGMYGPQPGPRDYNPSGGAPPYHGQVYGPQHALPHGPRLPIYHPAEIPGCLRPGVRMQRPSSGMSINPGAFGGIGPLMRHPQAQAPPSMQITSVNLGATSSVSGQPPTSSACPMQSNASMRPSKVLINPNFKGGVEAATNKFIKETQFMSTISNHVSHLQSDEELLRQQEEFINKNRQHIEKRRKERSPLLSMRRSRSRSRERTHSRERSYSPKRSGIGGVERFERDRDRERERERERDRDRERGGGAPGFGDRFNERDRERERDRDRGINTERFGRASSRDRERERDRTGYGGAAGSSGGVNRGGGNRFRRASSRDRDYENRGSSMNYSKRRRSLSPLPMRSGRRGGDRDRERNDMEEDEETRAYRLEIEKQKALREKILRDKEMRRRRAAEVKLNEEKPNSAGTNNIEDSNQHPQKLKPIIVTESKIISLKKKQQRYGEDKNDHQHHGQQQQQQRKQIPTAKILPEAKRSLSEHLANVAGSGGSGGTGSSSNTAIIKPVVKLEATMPSTTPPTTAVVAPTAAASMGSGKYSRHHQSSPSDDEVELDYDEDELMLEEEDRLLASPTPPPPLPQQKQHQQQLPRTRTPTPEPIKPFKSSSSSSSRNHHHQSTQKLFTSSNRRVILQTSSTSGSRREDGNKSRHGSHSNNSHRDNHSRDGGGGGSSGSSYSKGIFNRLDGRNKMVNENQSSSSNSKSQRKSQQQQRIVLKNN